MLIRKKLRLGVYFSLLLSAAMAAIVFYTHVRVERAGQLNRLSSDLIKELTEMRLLTFDAILHPGTLSIAKWSVREEHIFQTIESGVSMQTKETGAIFGRIQKNIVGIKHLFNDLASLGESGKPQKVTNEIATRLIGQILVRSQSIVTDATLLDHMAVDSALAMQRLQGLVLYALLILMSCGLALLILYANKDIMRSLERLGEDAKAIAGGDLEHTIETVGDDEIGELGKNFGAMASMLRNMVVHLKSSEESLRLIIDSSPIAVVAVDTEENVTLWNPAAEKIFGWRQDEIIGRHQPIIPDGSGYNLKMMDNTVGRGIISHETSCTRKNGLPVEVNLSTALLRDSGGIPMGLLTLIEDISQRRKAEEELRRSEERFRSTLDNMMEGCQIIGFDWRYLYINNTAARHGRRPREELMGSSMLTAYPGIETTEMFASLKRCMEERLPAQLENEFVYPDGKYAWFQLVIQPVAEGIFVLSMDITERKSSERELRLHKERLEEMVKERTSELWQSGVALMNIVEDLNLKASELEKANARLQEIDRLKSVFIASMSHELRTPLNSVIGFSSILLEEWLGPLNAEQKENLVTILASGKHLLALVNDVIDVSKVEAGVIDPHITEFDVHGVIDEAAMAFGKECADKGLSLQVESVHRTIRTDRRRLLQCLLNLLSNAVKFTERGFVSVSGRISQDVNPSGSEHIEILVEDSGIGIEADDMPKLFSPFTRLESRMKTVVAGTGLGLYLTKKLVEEVLGGEIEVSSKTGEGSVFTLRVPIGDTGAQQRSGD